MSMWQARRKLYRDAGRLDDQKYEDMIGRRVLRGLGVREKDIGLLEASLAGMQSPEQPLWPRVRALLPALRNKINEVAPFVLPEWKADAVLSAPMSPSLTVRLMLMTPARDLRPLILAMEMSGSHRQILHNDGLAVTYWHVDELMYLKPPYRVDVYLDDYRAVVQSIVTFFRQFGPYEHLLMEG